MAPQGLRERKKRETRRRIHACALRLVEQRGLASVTTDEIADAAGISPRTFFNYFATKDASVVGADPDLAEVIATAITEAPATHSPLDCLEQVFTEYVLSTTSGAGLKRQRWRVLESNPHLIPVMLSAGRNLEEQAAVALATRLGLEEDDPYPRLVSAAAYAVIRVSLERHHRDGTEVTDAVQQGFAALRSGLAAR